MTSTGPSRRSLWNVLPFLALAGIVLVANSHAQATFQPASQQAVPLKPAVAAQLQRSIQFDTNSAAGARAQSQIEDAGQLEPFVLKVVHTSTAGQPAAVTLDVRRLQDHQGAQFSTLFAAGQKATITPMTDNGEVDLRKSTLLSVSGSAPATVISHDHAGPTVVSSTQIFTTYSARPKGFAKLLEVAGVRNLSLTYTTSSLVWDAEKSKFVGGLVIGVIDRANSQAVYALDTPIPVQMVVDSGSASPSSLLIDHTGRPFAAVSVQANGSGDSFRIKLESQFDADLPEAVMPVVHPELTISGPSTMPGLGLGIAEVNFTAVASESLRPGQFVTIDLENGWAPDTNIKVGDHGIASTSVHSTDLGTMTIKLAKGVYRADPKTIQFFMPWGFFIGSIIGAALGAFVFANNSSDASKDASWRRNWSISFLVGLFAAAAAYVGIMLPHWIALPPALVGEAPPVVLAFGCALSCAGLLRWFSGRTAQPPNGT